jgi:hypothetical protein
MPPFVRHLLPLVAFAATWCVAQEPDADAPNAAPEEEAALKFRAYAKDIVSAYELRGGEGPTRELTLVAEPVLRWSNPLGGQRARGEVFLWTDAGLPAAARRGSVIIRPRTRTVATIGPMPTCRRTCCFVHHWAPTGFAPGFFMRMLYSDVLAVMKSVLRSSPPKQTLAGLSGTSICSNFLPSAL